MILNQNIEKHTGKRRIYDIIFFAFLATLIAAFENIFPRPLPYFRIGFSFIIIVIILDMFNLKELMLLIIVKNVAIAIMFAYIFTAPFYLGISGGLIATAAMKILSKTKIFYLFGISIIGAILNNITQIIIAKYLFSLPDIKIILPFIMLFSLISGSVVGFFSIMLSKESFKISGSNL